MLKKILAVLAMLMFAITSFAAVDANKGTAAELDALKGIGPAMSKRIIDARTQSQFKDWTDLMSRVKGVKTKTATKLSTEGLTVNGQPFSGAAAAAPAAAPAAKAAKVEVAPAKVEAAPAKAAAKP